MTDTPEYTPPEVWVWEKDDSPKWRYGNINRPIAGATHDKESARGKHPLQLYSLVLRFRGSNHIHASINLVLRSALARVSKDGHKRDRASGHPSRRRFAPPQDEVCVCLSSIRLIRLVS